MKETKYYIKYRNMYLSAIGTCEDFPNNEFIEKIVFRMNNFYCYIWKYEQAIKIIDKLVELGFVLDNFNLEEVEYED